MAVPEEVIGIYVYHLTWNVLSLVYYFEKMSSAQGDNVPEAMDTKEPEVWWLCDCVVLMKSGYC